MNRSTESTMGDAVNETDDDGIHWEKYAADDEDSSLTPWRLLVACAVGAALWLLVAITVFGAWSWLT